jgi:hypothetical protein
MPRTSGLRRSGQLRPRSAKREADYRARRVLVAELLEARPVCQRCQAARAVDVHEVLTRARGGSILDAENCVTLCRPCHSWITVNPAAALEQGWVRSSWDRKP